MTRTNLFFFGVLALAGSAGSVANAAHAAALTEAQISAIESLVTSFGASSDVTSHVDAALRGTVMMVSPGSASSTAPSAGALKPFACPSITRSVSSGSTDATTGGAVSALQESLIASGDYDGSVTGIFDRTTELAVQGFQRNKGIAYNGTPGTTGYGLAGPTTRGFLARACNSVVSGTPVSSSPAPATPTTHTELSAGASAGVAPFTASFTADLSKLSGRGELSQVQVQYGDGAGALICTFGLGGALGCPSTWTGYHTYINPGTYTITITRSPGVASATDVVSTTSVTVATSTAALPTPVTGETGGSSGSSGGSSQGSGGTTQSTTPPTISALYNLGKNGGTISGKGFTGTTQVYLQAGATGPKTQFSFAVTTDSLITMTADSPHLQIGIYFLWVVNPAGSAKWPKPFIIFY